MSDEAIETAARFWVMGGDTQDIAEIIGCTEAKIYNHLQFIRRKASEFRPG